MRRYWVLVPALCLLVGCGGEPTPTVPDPSQTSAAPVEWVRGPCPPGCYRSDLREADFQGAGLAGAYMESADLHQANLNGANLI